MHAESRGSDVGNGTGVVRSFWFVGCCCSSCSNSSSSMRIETSPPPHAPCSTLKLSNVRSNALFDFSQRLRHASRRSLASKSDCSARITSDSVATPDWSASSPASSANAFDARAPEMQFNSYPLLTTVSQHSTRFSIHCRSLWTQIS